MTAGHWEQDRGGFYQRGVRDGAKDIRQAIRALPLEHKDGE